MSNTLTSDQGVNITDLAVVFIRGNTAVHIADCHPSAVKLLDFSSSSAPTTEADWLLQ